MEIPIIEPIKVSVKEAHSREDIESALRATFGRYKAAYDSGRLDSNPELKWKFVGLNGAHEKTLGKTPPETTYRNEFNNHPSDPPAHYNQQEGIPVDGLIAFTQQEVAALPPDAPEREDLEEQLKILEDESISYVASSDERTHPGQLVARVTQEAHFIAHDPIMHAAIVDRLRADLGREPTQQEIDEANWYEGINTLTARRELVIPTVAPVVAPPPPDTAPPADADDTPPPAPVPTDEETPPGVTPPPPGTTPPATGDRPPVDSIDNLRIEATIIDHTQSTAQRAQKESQESVDNRMREGAWWQFWRWPQKTWIRWTQPYQVESGRQRLMEAMARNGTSYVTMETATRAIGQLGTERAKEQEDKQNILRRFTSGAVTDQANARGERIIEVTNQALRQRMVAEILRPIVESMRNGTPLTEDQVQNNLRTFVQNNLRTSPELQEFFGPNANDFGELASSFATDLMEMGRRTNEAMTRYNKTLGELDQYIHIRVASARGFDTDQRGRIATWVAEARRRESYWQAGLIEHAGGRLGVLLNPFVVGVGTSLALQGIMMLGRKEAIVAGGFLTGGSSLAISAVAGGLAGGIRRNSETWADYRRHLFERESGEGVVGPQGRRGLGARIGEGIRVISGGSSREELEGIRNNLRIATASQILEGGTTDVATGEQQRSVADLLASNDVQHIAGRIAEIQSRQRFGAENRIALISYTNVQQEISNLEIARYNLQQRLEAITTDPAAARTEIDRQRVLYDRQFTTSREQAEGAFNRYRLGNSLKAGVFGSITGLAGGLVSHELLNQIAHAAPQAAEIPVIGGLFGKHQVSEVAPAPPNPGITREILKQLYQNPGNLKLPNGMELAVDGQTYHATIIDVNGQTLPLPPINLTENGSIVVAGNPDLIPDDVKKIIAGWEIKPNEAPAFNFHNKLEQVIQSGQHEGLTHGNLEIDMNSAGGGQMSMRVLREVGKPDSGIQVHGFARMENGQPFLDIDQSFNGNANYSEADWKLLHNELRKDGWVINTEEVPGKTIIETNKPGAWEKHETLLERREWYDNNTRPSDLNELRMNTVKNGNAMEIRMDRMNADGSFSDMLDPRNLNVPQVVRDGRAGVAFSYPGEESKRALIAQVNTPRGLSLDPTDTDPNSVIHLWNDKTQAYDLSMQRGDFSKLVMNQNAYQNLPDGYIETELNKRFDVWRVGQDNKFGTISTGVPKVVNNNTVWQSAATIRGTETPQPTTIPPHFIYHVAPPPAIEIIAPPPPPISYAFDSMYIPTDFVPRRPLPPLVPRGEPDRVPGYPYSGYSLDRLSPEQREMLRQRRSQRLRNDPNAILDAEVEINDYFSQQTPAHMQHLEELLRQPGMNEPMHDNCDAVICIPTYTLGEGQVIQKTLDNYLLQIDTARNKQAIDPNKFELLIFLNNPANDAKKAGINMSGAAARVRAGKPEMYDTEEVIKQFQAAHPELKIRVMKHEYPGTAIQPWGRIIKDHYDAAILRASRRTNPVHKDPLIFTNDADLVNVSPTYVRDILQTMDVNEIASERGAAVRIDGLVGKIDMPNNGFDREPGFLAAMRLYEFMDAQVRKQPNANPLTQGRSTILRGSAYAAIGGPFEQWGAGADTLLGEQIKDARGNTSSIQYINKAWLYSDPRRELGKWQEGYTLAEAWNNWGDTSIYGTPEWQERIKRLPKNTGKIDKEKLQRDIYSELQRWKMRPDSPEFIRALGWVGLKPGDYHIGKIKNFRTVWVNGARRLEEYEAEGGIVIDKMTNLEANIAQFRKEKRWTKADKKVEKALKASPTSMVDNKLSAEYVDFEEFDRIHADIFGVKGDGSDSEYPWKPDPANPNPTIIDLGAHIGLSTLWWKHLAPGAKITAVEANPEIEKVLSRNVKRNKIEGDVKVVKGAVGSTARSVKFFRPKAGQGFAWEGFIADTNPNPAKYDEVTVPTVQLSKLINGPVDLLKLDVEGAEVQALQEAEPKLSQVKEIMMEFHNNPSNPGNSLAAAVGILQRQGYTFEIRENNTIVDPATFDTTRTTNLTIIAKRP